MFLSFISCEKQEEITFTDGDYKISSPSDGSAWERGRVLTIKWHEKISDTVIISITGLVDGITTTIATGGAMDWEIPIDTEIGKCKIVIMSQDRSKIDETGYFYIIEYVEPEESVGY